VIRSILEDMELRRERKWVLALLGALFLSACSENAELFSSLDEPRDPILVTISSGAVVRSDEFLELRIDYPDDEASRATWLVADLRDPSGRVYGHVEFDRDDLAEPALPPIQLPDPPDGVYRLSVEAWINDQILFTEERQIFVLSESPEIESLTIHPTSIHTDMQALAVVEVLVPDGTSPYLRWLFDGREVRQGYLSDGYDHAILEGASRSEGAYSVSLEMYPWGPDEGAAIDGAAPITAESDVYVHQALPLAPPVLDHDLEEFGGRVNRYFSFEGTRRAWTSDGSIVAEASLEGPVFLAMAAGSLGLRAGPGATVTLPVAPTPTEGESYLVVVKWASGEPGSSDEMRPLLRVGDYWIDIDGGQDPPLTAEETDPEVLDEDHPDSGPFETTILLLEGELDGMAISRYPATDESEPYVLRDSGGDQVAVELIAGEDAGQFFLNEVIVLALHAEEEADTSEDAEQATLEGEPSDEVEGAMWFEDFETPGVIEREGVPEGEADSVGVSGDVNQLSSSVDDLDRSLEPTVYAIEAVRWTVLERWWPVPATSREAITAGTDSRSGASGEVAPDDGGPAGGSAVRVEQRAPARAGSVAVDDDENPAAASSNAGADQGQSETDKPDGADDETRGQDSQSSLTTEEGSEVVEAPSESEPSEGEQDAASDASPEDKENDTSAIASDDPIDGEPESVTSELDGTEGELSVESPPTDLHGDSNRRPDTPEERPSSTSPGAPPVDPARR
jgi:hypothetical protein